MEYKNPVSVLEIQILHFHVLCIVTDVLLVALIVYTHFSIRTHSLLQGLPFLEAMRHGTLHEP